MRGRAWQAEEVLAQWWTTLRATKYGEERFESFTGQMNMACDGEMSRYCKGDALRAVRVKQGQ